MNCDSVRRSLSEYQVGGLSRWRRTQLARHLASCSACREEAAALVRTGEIVSQVGLLSAPDRTWEAARYRIETEGRRRGLQPARWRGLAIGALALAILVVGGITYWSGAPTPQRPQSTVQAEDEEMRVTMQSRVSTEWAASISDTAAAGLRMDPGGDDS